LEVVFSDRVCGLSQAVEDLGILPPAKNRQAQIGFEISPNRRQYHVVYWTALLDLARVAVVPLRCFSAL
jgi:hypothetical protein